MRLYVSSKHTGHMLECRSMHIPALWMTFYSSTKQRNSVHNNGIQRCDDMTQFLPTKFSDITLFIDELRTHNCHVHVINYKKPGLQIILIMQTSIFLATQCSYNRLLVLLPAE